MATKPKMVENNETHSGTRWRTETGWDDDDGHQHNNEKYTSSKRHTHLPRYLDVLAHQVKQIRWRLGADACAQRLRHQLACSINKFIDYCVDDG